MFEGDYITNLNVGSNTFTITHLKTRHTFYNHVHHMINMKSYKCLDNENLVEMIKYNTIYTKGLVTIFHEWC